MINTGQSRSAYLRHIRRCNLPVTESFLPWRIEGRVVGWLRPELAKELQRLRPEFISGHEGLHLSPAYDDFASRSAVLADTVDDLSQRGIIDPPMGELYPVTASHRDAALCVLDRAAAAYFGIRAFGQHLNGWVRNNGVIHMWIARRALDRLVFPGCLDNMVAGGLPWGVGMRENLVKEGWEEAALPQEYVQQAVAVSVVTYNRVTEKGFRPDVLYCYDLELSPDFIPHNTDGEVESFQLLPLDEVARLVRETDEFKLNCNLVIIDFLLRHGFIEPDEADYLELSTGLRPPLGIK